MEQVELDSLFDNTTEEKSKTEDLLLSDTAVSKLKLATTRAKIASGELLEQPALEVLAENILDLDAQFPDKK